MSIDQQTEDYVSEFIHTFGGSLDVRLWAKLVEEETKELLDAIRDEPRENILKEIADVMYVSFGVYLVCPNNLVHLLPKKEMDDIFMVLTEAKEVVGQLEGTMFSSEAITEAIRRVHVSNMSKLGEDGKPIRREDGKIMKGPNYKPPVLTDLVA